ncbi:unnamed protein product [Rotaria sp. Silwood1]|nr:unnamed protein product [Rotaria sp. Silwood1]CAF3599425.1 unnamed protein product [Rotaria sp. Silwood1]CAF3632954.1 unnamed protein product [Rotaria sp. Silwood1]CAF3779536.1 unnamed protein product [Rotaria sp. Silwood1]CAF4639363.1 unnamed protein product [Rotaria sp. Silwood1]
MEMLESPIAKALVLSIRSLAADLFKINADQSLPSIIDQWWCPICSTQTEDAPLCQMCQRILLQSAEDLPNDDQSKSNVFFYEYPPNDKISNVECGACGQPKHVPDNDDTPGLQTLMSLTVRDLRHKHESNAEIIFQRIIKYCKRNKQSFVDDQFPPSSRSLGAGSFNQCSQWLRISEVTPLSHDDRRLPWTIFSSPKPSDIQQGALGNCWLIAALALISEQPRLLEHILFTKKYNNEGVYLVRICHNGLWKTIIIDDYFPCTKHKYLVFTQAKHRQLYAPLIEKACAKLFGSYAALKSGDMREGLQLLTGAPCEYIDLDSSKDTFDSNLIWAKLLTSCKAKLLIGTSSGGNGVSSEEYARVHIHKNHAFSILSAHEFGGSTARFVLVRDPHSHSNYREDTVTESVLKQLRLVNPADHSTGAFWISWPRFLRYFSSITISTYNSDDFDIREQCKFTRSSTEYVMTYYLHVPKSTSITISVIHHRQDRTTRSSLTQTFVLCDADELKSNGIVGKRVSILIGKQGGHTYWSGSLPVGYYVLIPFSTGFWKNGKSNRDFTVVINSSVQVELTMKNKPATFLSDCLISAAMKNAKKKQSKEAIVYTTSGKLGLKMLIAENQSDTHNLIFDVDVQYAKNVRHSRHSGFPYNTHDCIPPRHRQIIFLTEWVDRHGELASLNYAYSYSHDKRMSNPKPSIDTSQHDFHSPRAV